ncbi:odorant receptor 49a-like isoform X2 [Harpegnathos saltator]|uniref:odorant receptor 49a-like isoform X2 n=1 Tax=Harpegnathos saltator TaxID=610380 RepID=UPI000DBEEBB2|nr:odorant receptor 49a-like isoform X2 [Harpegnathos saltator]
MIKAGDMNFDSVNHINVQLNKVSGNLLPMTNDSGFSVFWLTYGVVVWLFELARAIGFIFGFMAVSIEKIILDTMISIVYTTEVIFLNVQIQRHKVLMRQFILQLNNILDAGDEVMREVVMTTMKPVMIPLNFYWLTGVVTVSIWCLMPLNLLSKKSSFYYEDYRMPVAFSKQPFSATVFVLGTLVIWICSIGMYLKKVSVDIYMVNVVLLMTVQYRYITTKLALIFRKGASWDEGNDTAAGNYSSRVNMSVEKELKMLCRYYNTVVHQSYLLKKLLSWNLNLIYVTSIFRFCFGAIQLSTVLVAHFIVGLSITLFQIGGVMQFYILCSSVQKLSDASTEMTNMAFHENWYQFTPSIKRIFMLMVLSNNLGCEITTCEKLRLSLSAFMSVMNQAYSVALLVLRMK